MAFLWNEPEAFLDSLTSDGRGTIRPALHFQLEEDVAALRDAIEGLGTKEKVFIDILTNRSSDQRQLICTAYERATDRTLVSDLRGDSSGDFEVVLVALATPPAAFDCSEVKRALQGAGTDASTLIEIFASRSNQQIKALSLLHLEEEGVTLAHRLEGDLSGDFLQALLLLAEGKRDHGVSVDLRQAREDAKILNEAGEKQFGTDESKFMEILCQRSVAQLRRTLVEYKNLTGKSLQESLEEELSGDLQQLLVAIVKCVKSTPTFFAELLNKSMKGVGTDESTLTRIMVSRSEIDLLDVRLAYRKLYCRTLLSDIKSDVSGDYGDALQAVCGGDD